MIVMGEGVPSSAARLTSTSPQSDSYSALIDFWRKAAGRAWQIVGIMLDECISKQRLSVSVDANLIQAAENAFAQGRSIASVRGSMRRFTSNSRKTSDWELSNPPSRLMNPSTEKSPTRRCVWPRATRVPALLQRAGRGEQAGAARGWRVMTGHGPFYDRHQKECTLSFVGRGRIESESIMAFEHKIK